MSLRYGTMALFLAAFMLLNSCQTREPATQSGDSRQSAKAVAEAVLRIRSAKDPTAPAESHSVRYRESRFLRAEDMFRSSDDPALVTAQEASFLDDDDEVLGFVVDGVARAYSVRALCYHHVVNDQIGKVPIAVTY